MAAGTIALYVCVCLSVSDFFKGRDWRRELVANLRGLAAQNATRRRCGRDGASGRRRLQSKCETWRSERC